MWWLLQISGTHIWESWQFKSMYTLQGKTRPTRHMLFTFGPRMTLDHTYLTWSTYHNLSWITNRFGRIPLHLRNIDSWLHPQHADWSICGSPPSFSPPHRQWNSSLKPRFYRWQATSLTGPIYQYAIDTFNTCSWKPTHWSLTDIGGGYNLGGADFSHITSQPFQPVISTFHLKTPPDLHFNHKPSTKPKLSLKNIWPPHSLLTTRPSTETYIYV
jgi:hypothetical protein